MHKISFFPIGNADSYRIDLESGKKILIDYANVRDANDKNDKRIDLEAELRQDLKKASRKDYDVVAFTHLDLDHISGATSFFYLEHAQKYQGEDRVRIDTLWVPAAVILEEGLKDETKILQAEARYRLKQKKGIRVFSRPERLKKWIEDQGLNYEERKPLITGAGQLVPEFSKASDGVEFFVHGPFSETAEDGTIVDRNEASLVMQAVFSAENIETCFVLSSDTTHEVWASIVKQTKANKNQDRLVWDIFKLPHHCSYLSLGPEKGKDKTEPVPEVKWLFEDRGRNGCVVVSTSKPIPCDDKDDQPPHRQAANYYREITSNKQGEFKVTMEHPSESNPETLVIEIGSSGAKPKKTSPVAASFITGRSAPRAG